MYMYVTPVDGTKVSVKIWSGLIKSSSLTNERTFCLSLAGLSFRI